MVIISDYDFTYATINWRIMIKAPYKFWIQLDFI